MSKEDTASTMTAFWTSVDKLTTEGFKVTWFGVAVSVFGLIVTDLKWVSWFGIGATILGLVLRHRSEHLKRVKASPRTLSDKQNKELLNGLKSIPKQSMTVGFFGQDPEAKAYAIELKKVFVSAGFDVVRLEGFVVFDMAYGLEIVAYTSDFTKPIATEIQKAFITAGIEVRVVANSNKMQPPLSLNIHAKSSD